MNDKDYKYLTIVDELNNLMSVTEQNSDDTLEEPSAEVGKL